MSNICIQIQTSFSMLKSTVKIDDLIKRAKLLNYDNLAICDLNNMHGVIKFYSECLKNNINPIIGLNASIKSESYEKSNILLYAKNSKGYKNLLIISSVINLSDDGLITKEELKKYLKDLIVVTPGITGELERKILSGEDFNDLLNQYKDLFGNFYFGVNGSNDIYMDQIYNIVSNLSKNNNLECLMLEHVNYVNKSDVLFFDVLNAIDNNSNIDVKNYSNVGNYYLREKNELDVIYGELNNIIEVTKNTFKNIKYEFDFDKYLLPKYPMENEQDSDYYLANLCEKELTRFSISKKKLIEYKKRLYDELKIIKDMGFADYFLIVWDFVKYAKDNNILVGPGRGSAAGSLVAYVLGITEVDPLKFNLLFERFLNPERITMPDIDLDFPDDKRDDVIAYVHKKYGKNKVTNIVAFGTFAARSAIRDVAKVLKIESNALGLILDEIPTNASDIKGIVSNNKTLQNHMHNHEELRVLIDIASSIEGLPRHTTTHAAGIIINDENIVNYSPLQKGLNGLYQTQFEAYDLEKIGLLKIDFLGLRNLKTIQDIIKEVKEKEKKDIDILKIPLDDKLAYEVLKSGDTNGIFQMESKGMKNVLREMETSTFDDIVAVLALYRPGPMENISTYISRKKGLETIEYLHKDLKKILEPTYGIIVYQEQIMQIANQFAGYSLGEADILRRAISKKDRQTLDIERKKFVSKCVGRNYDEKIANSLYDYIVKFADYGFNKSHSVAYSLISYQLAYLKAHYPKIFMKNLLTSVIGSEGQISKYIKSIRNTGGSVLRPSINTSDMFFAVVDEGLVFPLVSIKNVGRIAAQNIIDERSNKLFKTFEEFIDRMHKKISSRVIESLIFSGALDDFKVTKKGMFEKLEDVINLNDLGGFIDKRQFAIDYPKEEYDYDYLSQRERDLLGINISYHPLLRYEQFISKHQLQKISDIDENVVGETYKILAYCTSIKEVKTRGNKLMAFMTLEDDIISMDSVLFPNVYETMNGKVKKGDIVYILGRLEDRNNKKQITIERISKINKGD